MHAGLQFSFGNALFGRICFSYPPIHPFPLRALARVTIAFAFSWYPALRDPHWAGPVLFRLSALMPLHPQASGAMRLGASPR